MTAETGDDPVEGAVAPELAAELPGLRLRWTVVTSATGRTPRALRDRLEDVSNRFRGPNAIALRTRPVPRAYRVLFRQVGLDPDVDRTPVEQAAVERLVRGELHSGDRVADALVLAVIETGVPVVAFDEAALNGEVTLRAAAAGETLPAGKYAHDLPRGRVVLADAHGPVAVLFGRMSDRHAPGRGCTRVRLVAVQAPGVPRAHVDEALWLAASGLSEAAAGAVDAPSPPG
ncbi:MAG TPA: phenylalanine--tRNA ligase beta subunit-related protein [Baekduia sp.]|nr:phenylalanine--tRNA ligase beta subunit-related protein [Baekduia sp.]